MREGGGEGRERWGEEGGRGGGGGEKQKEVHDRSRGRTGLKLLMPAANRFSVAL